MLIRIFTYARNAVLRPTGRHGIHGCASAPHGEAQHRPRRTRYPRHARCGLSLFEAVLVMMIAVPLAQQGVRLAQHYIRAQAGVQESRLLTQVVTAASTYALRDLDARITVQGVGNIEVLTMGDLAIQNAWVGDGAVRTALGRDIEVIFYNTGLGELVVLARAWTPAGEQNRPYMPRGGIGIGLVGTIRADAPTQMHGPGINYDLGPLQAQATTQDISHPPAVGDQLAIAVLRMDQDVLPYLHRKKVGVGKALSILNRMETDLDMGGKDLTGVKNLDAQTITVIEAMNVGELTGTLKVEGNVNVVGDLTVPETLTSDGATIAGRIKATGLDVSGTAQLDTVDAQSVRITSPALDDEEEDILSRGVIVTGTVTVNGQVTAETLAASKVRAGVVRSPKIIADSLIADCLEHGSSGEC